MLSALLDCFLYAAAFFVDLRVCLWDVLPSLCIVAMVSSVVDAWEKCDFLVSAAQKEDLVCYSNNNGTFCRRDVVNNAELLGPLIASCGSLVAKNTSPQKMMDKTSSDT